MHKLNNGIHAFVFPTRCGTRWLGQILFEHKLLDYIAPNHFLDIKEYDQNLQNIMFVRNPFTRERSIYRWRKTVHPEQYENITFSDFVNSDLFYDEPTWTGTYQNNIKLIDKFVHLENISTFLKQSLNLDTKYSQEYNEPADIIEDVNAYTNDMKQKVLDKYKDDLKLIDFDLTSYV
jgi:hypothetical protein